MPKNTTYSKVRNISLDIRLNWPAAYTDAEGNQAQGYAPAFIRSNMQAVTDDGGLRDLQRESVVGTVRATEYTPAELANIVKGSSNSTGNALLAELTALYNDAIGGVA